MPIQQELFDNLGEFTAEQTTRVMNQQIPAPKQVYHDTYWKNAAVKYMATNSASIPLFRGGEIIAEAIPFGPGERPSLKRGAAQMLAFTLARYAHDDAITVSDVKEFNAFKRENVFSHASIAELGAKVQTSHKTAMVVTRDLLCAGALDGDVVDPRSGESKFRFQPDDIQTFEFRDRDPEDVYLEMELYVSDETSGMHGGVDVEVDLTLWKYLKQYATDNGLFRNRLVTTSHEHNRNVMDYNGRRILLQEQSFQDRTGVRHRLLPSASCRMIPRGVPEMFVKAVGYAEHVKALSASRPEEFFSDYYPIDKGQGMGVISEMVMLPINTRPYAIGRGKLSPA